mmetsp:Transcript_9250/g.22911  ORF Transcript_9250/g.22911 Transcript_9250/m.22911 type:complete len:231 (+) Transcript_9250:777-1469(+)
MPLSLGTVGGVPDLASPTAPASPSAAAGCWEEEEVAGGWGDDEEGGAPAASAGRGLGAREGGLAGCGGCSVEPGSSAVGEDSPAAAGAGDGERPLLLPPPGCGLGVILRPRALGWGTGVTARDPGVAPCRVTGTGGGGGARCASSRADRPACSNSLADVSMSWSSSLFTVLGRSAILGAREGTSGGVVRCTAGSGPATVRGEACSGGRRLRGVSSEWCALTLATCSCGRN